MKFISARQAWAAAFHQASPPFLRTAGSTALDSSDRAWEALERGKVIAAINTLTPLKQSWGMCLCTYPPEEEKKIHTKRLLDHAHAALTLQCEDVFSRSFAARERFVKLIRMSLDDAIIRECSVKPKYSPAVLARAIDIDPRNWDRDWDRFYKFLLDQFLGMTGQTFAPVQRLVDLEIEARIARGER